MRVMSNAAATSVDTAALMAVIKALQQENEYLRLQLAKARRERFGRSCERGDLLAHLPESLPREEHRLAANDTCRCPACGGALKFLGEDVSEMLEFVPARFMVIRTVRPKLACGRCDVIVQAPAPSRPISRGFGRSRVAGAGSGGQV